MTVELTFSTLIQWLMLMRFYIPYLGCFLGHIIRDEQWLWRNDTGAENDCYKLFKACFHYVLSNFMFSSNHNYSKTMKDVFILSRKLSSFSRYSHFWIVIVTSFFFFDVSHCFRGWSKINLKVYDIINR